MTLFDLVATLSLDTKDFEAKVNEASQAGKSLGETLGTKVTAKAVAMGNAIYDAARRGATALINLGKVAVQNAADIAAENAQFEATFGDLQGIASNVLKIIGKDTNIVAGRLNAVGTKVFAQFKGAGVDAADAMMAMDTYMRLAADAAAYYDMSLEAADERMRSFLRGNTEAGDAIGLFTSESQRNTYALERYGKQWQKLTEAQKQMLMLDIASDIYAQGGALGQAAREGSGWANVLANFNRVLTEISAKLATPFSEHLTPFVEKMTSLLSDKTFVSRLEELAAALGEVAAVSLEEVAAGIETLLTGEVNSDSKLSQIVGSLQSFSDWCKANSSLVTAALGAVAVALGLVSSPALVVIAALALLAINWDTVTNAVNTAIAAVGEWVDTKVKPAWESVLKGIIDTWNSITGAIGSAIAKLREFFRMSASGGRDIFTNHSAYKGGYGTMVGGTSASAIAFDSGSDVQIFTKTAGYATGLDYVPYNNFYARLHEGEAVLTKAEATAWRQGEGQGIDVAGLREAVVSAVRDGMTGLAIQMDGQAVGDIVTTQVSRNIAQAAYAGRY